MIRFVFLLFLLCFFCNLNLTKANNEENYHDVFIQVHQGKEDGQVISFKPEDINSLYKENPEKNTLDFLQSIFLKINFRNQDQIYIPKNNEIILVNHENQKENTDSDDIFLLNPEDGFLHFRIKEKLVKKEFFNINAELININIPENEYCTVDLKCNNFDNPINIKRGKTPYGFFENENPKTKEVGLYQKNIDLNLERQIGNKKTFLNLVILKNEKEKLPNIVKKNKETPVDNFSTITKKFDLRSNEALNWALHINKNGLENDLILDYNQRMIHIANIFLIIIILIIAALLNFHIINNLNFKRIFILLAICGVAINFSSSFTKLIIQGTNQLQAGFLKFDNEQITKIHNIFNEENLIYNEIKETTQETQIIEKELGKIEGKTKEKNKIYNPEGELEEIEIEKNFTYSITQDDTLISEENIFNNILIIIKAIGCFLISIILIFRNIILWFLVIFSPIAFILPILPVTSDYFRYWSFLFFKWIFIGPILIASLSFSIYLWSNVGMPISSFYESKISFENSNLKSVYNTKSMMEYIVFLAMIYIPIFLSFKLTQKSLILQKISEDKTENKKSILPKIMDFYFDKENKEKMEIKDKATKEKEEHIITAKNNIEQVMKNQEKINKNVNLKLEKEDKKRFLQNTKEDKKDYKNIEEIIKRDKIKNNQSKNLNKIKKENQNTIQQNTKKEDLEFKNNRIINFTQNNEEIKKQKEFNDNQKNKNTVNKVSKDKINNIKNKNIDINKNQVGDFFDKNFIQKSLLHELTKTKKQSESKQESQININNTSSMINQNTEKIIDIDERLRNIEKINTEEEENLKNKENNEFKELMEEETEEQAQVKENEEAVDIFEELDEENEDKTEEDEEIKKLFKNKRKRDFDDI